MRRWNLTLAAALMTTAAVAQTQAAGLQVAPPQGTAPQPFTPFPEPPAPGNPFGHLFGATPFTPKSDDRQPFVQVDPKTFTPALQKPRIVCGMVVVTVDGHLDPKFVHEIPKSAVKGTMKILPPPPCEK